MCGISGFNWCDKELIKVLNDAIQHRGKDGYGYYVDDFISLGHRRLSILDLSDAGKQPMSDINENYWIVHNGEVYNFKEIKEELKEIGCNFRSKTDTEVILKAYEKWGISSFEKFNGIFAFAIYDKKERKIILCRDRLGVKPLYYFYDGKKFIFSSEVKGIYQTFKNQLHFSLKFRYIQHFFYANLVESESFFTEIKKVPQGTFLELDLENTKLDIKEYYIPWKQINQKNFLKNARMAENSLIDRLDVILNKVVKRQLISDAPIGTICSGGLDSSLITVIAKKFRPDLEIYHVSVNDKVYNETKYAKLIAEKYDTKLKIIELDKDVFLKYLNKCTYMNDIPLIHVNAIGIHLLSKKAKEDGVKVLLSGEGADELFGGYTKYKNLLRALRYKKYLDKIIEKKKDLIKYFSILFQPEEFILSYFLRNKDLNDPISKPFLKRIREIKDKLSFIKNNNDRLLKSYLINDLNHYLINILQRTDRMSMMNQIEMRVPFLDNELLDFCIHIPVKYQVKFKSTKYILKRLSERYLPKEIIYRQKEGFGIPTARWLKLKDNNMLKNKLLSIWNNNYLDKKIIH